MPPGRVVLLGCQRTRRFPAGLSSYTVRPWASLSGSPPPPPTTSETYPSPTSGWPTWKPTQISPAKPAEIKAVYSNRHAVPRETWLSPFGSAEREIGVLACSGLFLAREPSILHVLADRARDGLRVRICLRDPDGPVATERSAGDGASDAAGAAIREALALFGQLHENADVEIRLHQAVLYNSIYQSDDQLLVSQHAYGISDERAPVLSLRWADDGDLVATYLDAFERIWAGALPLA
jgi:hypothetical protein